MTTATTPDQAQQATFVPSAETLRAVLEPSARPKPPNALSASVTFGWRAVLKLKHVPEQMFDVTALPIIMTLIFTYLFGGAIAGGTGEYLQFFLPGVLVSSIIMITMYTGVGLNTDIEKGVFDRIRSLPIWRPAALVGMIIGDILRYIVASVIIVAIGLILGFRPDGGFVGVVGAIGLVMLFSFGLSWLWTLFGLVLRSEKSVMSMSMLVLFPLTFLSSVFVPVNTMPGWLQAFVKINPVTLLTDASRSLMNGSPDGRTITYVLIWTVCLTAVFGALTMVRYNRR